jgi:mRNA interferase MazF
LVQNPAKPDPYLLCKTNLLNKINHPSTIVCPITSNVQPESDILRVHLKKGMANLQQDCDIMIDQIRAIDNRRLTKRIGTLPNKLIDKVKENIMILLSLE